MKESNIQSLFTAYIKQNRPQRSEVYELKIVKGKNLPFNALADHQRDALLRSSVSGGNYWKIPDTAAISGFTSPKPYDCQYIVRAKAYVCPCWYIPRKRKTLYKITIQEWMRIQGVTQRKSITEDMAIEIAEEIIEL